MSTTNPAANRGEVQAEYRDLLATPREFADGFTGRTVLGAFFIGFLMMPGAIYMGLIAGSSLGPAAEWVTIILFAEVARRSFTPLGRQEIYVLYYIAGGLTHVIGGVMLAGGSFASLIWHQYLVQSQVGQALVIAEQIPAWVSPPADSPAIVERDFLHRDWLLPAMLLVAGQVLARVDPGATPRRRTIRAKWRSGRLHRARGTVAGMAKFHAPPACTGPRRPALSGRAEPLGCAQGTCR